MDNLLEIRKAIFDLYGKQAACDFSAIVHGASLSLPPKMVINFAIAKIENDYKYTK